MEKEYHFLILFYAAMITLIVLSSTFLKQPFRTGIDNMDHVYIEKVSFTGLSGDESNSVVLFMENVGTYRDIVLDHANITCSDWEKMSSIVSGERDLPLETSSEVVLFNVAWMKDVEYTFKVFNTDGQLVGALRVTA